MPGGCAEYGACHARPTSTRASLYLRVSTAQQPAIGVSLEEQEYRLRAGARRRRWPLVQVRRDHGYPGGDADYPRRLASPESCHGQQAIAYPLPKYTPSSSSSIR
jgi:hypothetical protein